MFILEWNKMTFVMAKENLNMLMEECMMVNGNMELWMDMVGYIIQIQWLHLMGNGVIMHLLDKAQYTMKNLFHLTKTLITQILISLKNTGKNMKENSEMILKKDKVYFSLQMERNMSDNFIMIWLMEKEYFTQMIIKSLKEHGLETNY